MQKALGDQWQQLPLALKSHYQHNKNSDTGYLNVEYPIYMYPYLTFLHLFGVLINRRGKNLPTTVEKHMQGQIQFWKRTINFPESTRVLFNSFWIYDKNNELIEFINPFIGYA
jgi:hypothetical protein